MNLKAIFSAILFFWSITLVNAQSKDILAKSAMLNADEAYANGQYSECLGFLKDAETNLGATNSRIQYLKVKSVMAMGTNDQYNKTIWSQAEAELKLFFEVTPENGYVPEKYDEMIMAVGKVKNNITQINEKEASEIARAAEKEANEKLAEYNREMDLKNNPGKYFDDACKGCDLALVEKLLGYGAKFEYKILKTRKEDSAYRINNINYDPISYFIECCTKKDEETKIELIKLYIENNASDKSIFEHPILHFDPNPIVGPTTCLVGCDTYLGAFILRKTNQENHRLKLTILKLCIDNGMNVNQDQGSILSALTFVHSASTNCYDMIEYLLKKGADPNLTKRIRLSGYPGASSKSAIWWAEKNKKTDLVDLFKKYK